MEVGEDKLLSLAKEMPKRQDTWEEIVRKFDLLAPANFQEFVGQSFVYTDFILGAGATELPPVLVSTIKIRQAGFQDCMDTEDMFRKWITDFQQKRLLPPVDW
jgi:hypothetical protein